MSKLLYNLGIRSYSALIHSAAPFKDKASQWVRGRKEQVIEDHEGCIWFHCASLGEFEQARPLIEQLKESGEHIVITFFSPSGFEVRKNYELADAVYYLPLDKESNAKAFLNKVKPSKAIFIKYEVWHYYFRELKARNIPLYLVSATFRSDQIYFKSHGGFMRKTLQMVDQIFTQNQASSDLLETIGIDSIVAGDTRFDRVWNQSQLVNKNSIIENFKGNDRLIIAGSSWPKEEALLAQINLPDRYKLVVAPHDISDSHVNQILQLFPSAGLYSDGNQSGRVMILNTIGHLASAYSYADIAVVGGGFKNALHNILEPACFGIPVLYGNNHPKYPEGIELAEHGGGFSLSEEDLKATLNRLMSDESFRKECGKKSFEFIESKTGATAKILASLED